MLRTVTLCSEAEKQLLELPLNVQERVRKVQEKLGLGDRVPMERIVSCPGFFRVRTGDYRIILHYLGGGAIEIDQVFHRSRGYKKPLANLRGR